MRLCSPLTPATAGAAILAAGAIAGAAAALAIQSVSNVGQVVPAGILLAVFMASHSAAQDFWAADSAACTVPKLTASTAAIAKPANIILFIAFSSVEMPVTRFRSVALGRLNGTKHDQKNGQKTFRENTYLHNACVVKLTNGKK
jgi:hypothetical protein